VEAGEQMSPAAIAIESDARAAVAAIAPETLPAHIVRLATQRTLSRWVHGVPMPTAAAVALASLRIDAR
jgi:hypothetical protein